MGNGEVSFGLTLKKVSLVTSLHDNHNGNGSNDKRDGGTCWGCERYFNEKLL